MSICYTITYAGYLCIIFSCERRCRKSYPIIESEINYIGICVSYIFRICNLIRSHNNCISVYFRICSNIISIITGYFKIIKRRLCSQASFQACIFKMYCCLSIAKINIVNQRSFISYRLISVYNILCCRI